MKRVINIFRKAYSKLLFELEPEPFFMNQNKNYSAYEIGDWTYGNPVVRFRKTGATLKIGKFCAIASGVTILLGGEHRVDWATTYPFNVVFDEAKEFKGHPRTRGDVVIGNDVWIGQDVFIISGVVIGNGAVIGARSVVTKDVAPYSIAAGNPATLVRFRFSDSQIEALQKIAWWDWPWPEIMEALPLLLTSDIDAFIDKYSKD
jgi:acetyltransferase-like isoleucine patch superfamily enzyme